MFLGGPWFVSVFQLPQKFQIVHGSSGLRAGIQTMPFTFAAPLGSAFSSMAAGKLRIPVVYVVLCAGVLQVIGYALLASLPASTKIVAREYGYQVIAGFGCGINISTLLLIVPFVVEGRDKGEQPRFPRSSSTNLHAQRWEWVPLPKCGLWVASSSCQ